MQGRPEEQPQLHAHQPRGTDHAQQQHWGLAHARQQLTDPFPVFAGQHEQCQAGQRQQCAPAKDLFAIERSEQGGIEVHHGEQAGGHDRTENAF
ncbi:hypothetical protein D3C81_1436300 [compost metagenome]